MKQHDANLAIARRLTGEEIYIALQKDVSEKESSGK